MPACCGCEAAYRTALPQRYRRSSMPGTLTRANLADTMHKKLGFSRAESLDMIESLLQHIGDRMKAGENVKIAGFGTFMLREKNQRVGRNPKTGIEVPITPRTVVTFRASQILKDRVSGL
ncbi:integration host factor subunit alpha [Croceicoccus sp. F390]|uniref:Integration host factor subunit alpha n=1 Tax=Croceicoccus esteveae TaxID=3075597 RepID=A0ABU2ZEL7_9SPHN|nr:integration host factor subunit alpha [Croceicoccus sp. F390]MDT0575049.1 integration host factor subunit alpha [Croceicoccus sp. F390]